MAAERKLKIPERLYPGFKQLLSIQGEALKELENALDELPPDLHIEDFVLSVAQHVSLSFEIVNTIVRTLINLYIVRFTNDITIADFSEDITASLQSLNDISLSPADGKWDDFREKLAAFLCFDSSLGITAKAMNVLTEYEHAYCTEQTRVLTDMRPIFSSNADNPPTAALIVHAMKLSYHEGDDVKSIFVALDTKELHELRKMLERAEKKAESLLSVIRSTNMQYLDPEV